MMGGSGNGWGDTCIGNKAGYDITGAWGCTLVGNEAGQNITTGEDNTSIGHNSGSNITTGNRNTLVGVSAGDVLTTGGNNICIGFDVDPTSATVSNTITLGNNSISTLRCNQTSISSLSDKRDKTDIVDLPIGLDFINSVRPVKFKWQRREPDINDGLMRAGFIAQELEEAQKDSEYLNLINDDNPDKLEAQQGNLIPVMVQAIKDLSAENTALKARLDAAGL